jgi:hypothetical protein
MDRLTSDPSEIHEKYHLLLQGTPLVGKPPVELIERAKKFFIQCINEWTTTYNRLLTAWQNARTQQNNRAALNAIAFQAQELSKTTVIEALAFSPLPAAIRISDRFAGTAATTQQL